MDLKKQKKQTQWSTNSQSEGSYHNVRAAYCDIQSHTLENLTAIVAIVGRQQITTKSLKGSLQRRYAKKHPHTPMHLSNPFAPIRKKIAT